MARFNQFLILFTLLIFAACTKLALANTLCTVDDVGGKSLADMQKLSKFLQMNEKHPEFMYHYNGVSVTKERFEKLMLEKRDIIQDPNMRLP